MGNIAMCNFMKEVASGSFDRWDGIRGDHLVEFLTNQLDACACYLQPCL